LRARLDPSDVLQEAYVDASAQLEGYLADPRKPPFLWLRFLVGERLIAIYRRHLGAQKRDARREVALYQRAMPDASSMWLSRELAADLTSPSLAAVRNETLRCLEQMLAQMPPLDREILSLRHYEELSNAEVAEELGISEAAASKRYVRAVRRLKEAADALASTRSRD
jgi:RNA polymerase sigma-70 factor (ECF subfamily)